jgi:hypothetical protein
VSRLLVAQRALTVPGWAKDALWRRAQAIPSLDLRFADNKSLVDATTGSNLVTFTRASSGTYVDSTGVLRSAAANLLLRSEEFDNAAWAPIGLLAFGSGSTANAIASPNGQITADLLTESTTTGTHQVQQTASVTIGQVYTCSVFCKLGPNAVRRIQLLVTNANFTVTPIATFDLTTGTVVSVVQGTASITSYANGWYRLVLNTIAATSTGVNGFHFRLVDTGTNNSYTGDGSAGLYLWGAQLEQSATVGEYIPTTSTINSAPRFDHDPTTGESLGLLVEEPRTSLLIWSEDTSHWLVPTNITISQNQTTAPDNLVTADQYLETTATGLHAQGSVAFLFVAGTTYTYSVFVKSIGGRNFTIGFPATGFTARFANFNLSGSGSVQSADVGVTPGIKAYPNGWYRCSATSTCASGAGARMSNFITNSSYSISYAGDVTKGIYIWGAQLEAGAFPTSYIPTTTVAVTRSADVASITGSNFSSWYRQDEGTVFADYEAGPGVASRRTLSINDATAGNVIQLITSNASGSASNYSEIVTLGVSQGLLGAGTAYAPVRQTSALAYVVNNVGFAKNGGAASVDLTVSIPTVTRLEIGSNLSATLLNGAIRRLTYWPTRLGNEVLQRITQ